MSANLWKLLWNALSLATAILAAIATDNGWWTVGAVLMFNAGVLIGGCYVIEKEYADD